MTITLAFLLLGSVVFPSALKLPVVQWGDKVFLGYFFLVSVGQWLGNFLANQAAKSLSVSLLNIVKVSCGARRADIEYKNARAYTYARK